MLKEQLGFWGLCLLAAACTDAGSIGEGATANGGSGGQNNTNLSGGTGTGGSGGHGSACTSEQDASSACRAERNAICATRSLSDCDGVSYCQLVTGQPLKGQCVGGSSVVGCVAIGCNATWTQAKDPAGDAWLFSSSCVPGGWTEIKTASPMSACIEPAPVVGSKLERNLPSASSAADRSELAVGNEQFSIDLLHALTADAGSAGKNLAVSPISVATALSMLNAGTRGVAAQQLVATLHFTLPDDRLYPAFNALQLDLAGRGAGFAGTNGRPFAVRIANSLWADDEVPLEQPYLDILGQNYDEGGVRVVDFSGHPDESRQRVNLWVEEKTENLIRNFFQPAEVNEGTITLLVNTIYFNAKWATVFDPQDTLIGTFQTPTADVQLPLMHLNQDFAYMTGSKFAALALPYDDQRLQMLIVLPDAGELEAVAAALNGDSLAEIESQLVSTDVRLSLPRFKVDGEKLRLKEVLSAMGMRAVFAGGDLSGITRFPIQVSDVLHKAYLDVGEEGTEAAAVTGIPTLGAAPQKVQFTVTRPFLVFVRDLPSQTTLFWARVLDPR